MARNTDNHMRIVSQSEAETIYEGSLHDQLQGTFYTPVMPSAMTMTSYVSPGAGTSAAAEAGGQSAIGTPVMWVDAGAPEAANFPYMIARTGERYDIAHYTECKADSGVDQINGVMIICDAGTTDNDDIRSPGGKYFYQSCKKLGSGTQINGIEVVYHGGSKIVPMLPSMPGRWDKMDMLNAEGKEIKGAPKNQINGGRVRLMKRSEIGAMAS
ncbi:hypothetical protein A9Z42_0080680 [Trichoderma parareesei]|uniref:Uncharacterized protein n=1 Tax=Trichoderma parareesei TaxID=858221 RepID=A0A2H3A7P3_TRIPA|nr:hypothetical protein A9Z42_0080680 [Trichoderma parareesei]